MKYTSSELCQKLGITENYLSRNFCKVARVRLAKGILIEREKQNGEWLYQIKQVEPMKVEDSFFTSRPKDTRVFENEKWISSYLSNDYEVSNLGRLRDAHNKKIYCGTLNCYGYRVVSIHNKKVGLHRLVAQSFYQMENFEDMTVDHINGKRDDNRLENLRIVSKDDNMKYMLMERGDLNKELTRIIQKYGYDKTLKLLKDIT